MKVGTGFHVHSQILCTRGSEFRNEGISIGDHQVDIERELRHFFQSFNDQRPYREVWHKMSIHHIDMQEIRARPFDRCNFICKASKIGGQD